MAQCFRAFAALAADASLVSSIHVRWLTNACKFSSRESDVPLWLPEVLELLWHTRARTHTQIMN